MFVPVVFGLFGLIVGSFLNVLVLRYGVRSIGGRSTCSSCGQKLVWHDMVPVLSWVFLRGRCRYCKAPISLQYPLVELSTAILFGLIGMWAGPALHGAGGSELTLVRLITLNYLVIAALLIAIFVYDLYHAIIPDPWVYSFCVLAFIGQFFVPFWGVYVPRLFLAGPITAAPLFALWFFSRGTWMGFGDVKLALGMGWLLGPWGGLQTLFLAFMLGGAVSAPLLFFSSSLWERLSRKITPIVSSAKAQWGFTMKSEIPFGPFLIVATFIIWLLNMYGVTFGDFFA